MFDFCPFSIKTRGRGILKDNPKGNRLELSFGQPYSRILCSERPKVRGVVYRLMSLYPYPRILFVRLLTLVTDVLYVHFVFLYLHKQVSCL